MGTVLGRVVEVGEYRVKIKKQIAEGGFSHVYLVVDVRSGTRMTLKQMRIARDNTEMLKLAGSEVDLMRSLPPHPHVVRYIASSTEDDGEFTEVNILMEYCAGGTALDAMQRAVDCGEALPERTVLRLFHDVCLAVAHMHAQPVPIAHRDLKVENMLLVSPPNSSGAAAADGAELCVKLCDFGSCVQRQRNYRSGREIAAEEEFVQRYTTFQYRAPEMVDLHADKVVGVAVDVWALGCVLFKLCFNKTPFEDESGTVTTLGIMNGSYAVPRERCELYSAGLRDLIAAALTVDPAARPSVFALLEAGQRLPLWPTCDSLDSMPPVRSVPPLQPSSDPTVDVLHSGQHGAASAADGRAAEATGERGARYRHEYPKRATSAPVETHAALEGLRWESDSVDQPAAVVSAEVAADATTTVVQGDAPQAGIARGAELDSSGRHGGSLQSSPILTGRGSEDGKAGGSSAANEVSRTVEDSTIEQRRRVSSISRGSLSHAVESVQGRVFQLLGGAANKRRWVMRLTSREPGAPKPKYVRRVVLEVWKSRSLDVLVHNLPSRPLNTHPVVAVKALVAVLKVLQLGPPEAVLHSVEMLPLVGGMCSTWSNMDAGGVHGVGAGGITSFVALYASLVVGVLQFHRAFPLFDAAFLRPEDRIALPGGDVEEVERRGTTHSRDADGASVADYEPQPMSGRGWLSAIHAMLKLCSSATTVLRNAFDIVDDRGKALPSDSSQPTTHREVDCAVGGIPALVPFTLNVYRGAFLGLTLLGDDGARAGVLPSRANLNRVAALRDRFAVVGDDVRRSFNEVRTRAPRHAALSVLDGVPALDEANPLANERAARTLRLARRRTPIHERTQRGGAGEVAKLFLAEAVGASPFSSVRSDAGDISGAASPDDADSDADETAEQHRRDSEASAAPELWMDADRRDPYDSDGREPEAAAFAAAFSAGGGAGALRAYDFDPFGNAGLSRELVAESPREAASAWPGEFVSGIRGDTHSVSASSVVPMFTSVLPGDSLRSSNASPVDISAAGKRGSTSSIASFDPFADSEMPLFGEGAVSPSLHDKRRSVAIVPARIPPPAAHDGALLRSLSSRGSADSSIWKTAAAPASGDTERFFSGLEPMAVPLPDEVPKAMLCAGGAGAADVTATMDKHVVAHAGGEATVDRKRARTAMPNPFDTNGSVFSQAAAGHSPSRRQEPGRVGRGSTTVREPDARGHDLGHSFADVEARKNGVREGTTDASPAEAGLRGADGTMLLAGRDLSRWPAGVEIPFSRLHLTARIGSGGFSEVFKGTYGDQAVAVKRLLCKPGEAGDKAMRDFKAEVSLMTRLRHPNIVRFMGVVVEPLCLVTEFCSNGNLFDLLHNNPISLSWLLRLRMALEAAQGMHFLHNLTPCVIHRDLKSLNLLVDSDFHIKVSDFGLSRFKALTSTTYMTAQCGTFHWMAPEVVGGQRYTEKADVYSFGINLWELLTRRVPYKGMQPMQVGIAVYTRGVRPSIPRDTPPDYAALMAACWHANPAYRPTFDKIIQALLSMQEEAEDSAAL